MMRKIFVLAMAASLGAAPAVAQNETATGNVVDVNATNMAVPADNELMAANNMVAVPPPAQVTTETAVPPAPEPRRERGFPWGIIGLVGLVGLLGRRRRD